MNPPVPSYYVGGGGKKLINSILAGETKLC